MKNIVVIAAGSFHGKSLISMQLAAEYGFSGVVTTDMIRNLLRIQNSSDPTLSTSTYLLTEHQLEIQKQQVSQYLPLLIETYVNRGEKVIIEGMHFTNDVIEWFASQNVLGFCLDNIRPIEERVMLKHATRSRLGLYNQSGERFFGTVSPENVHKTSYIKYAKRIKKIHDQLIEACKRAGFYSIEFNSIDLAIQQMRPILNTTLPPNIAST